MEEQTSMWDEEPIQSVGPPVPPPEVFKPNTGQQTAIDYLVPFCLDETDYVRVLLQGYAGTGKTWTINRVVEQVRKLNPRISFGMTAPTHKAVRQLYKHSELKDQLDFGTIHSFLGLKIKLVPHPTKRYEMIEDFVPDENMIGNRKIDSIHVLIVDESSMLPDSLYNHIDDAVRSGRIRVIFMGDGLQIPPVKSKENPDAKIKDAIPFIPEQRESRKIHLLELNEIVRQGAGNPIIEYSVAIREQYKQQAIRFEIPVHGHEPSIENGICKVPRDITELRSIFRRFFCTDTFKNDPDHMKVIAWRNDTVDYFNKEIRLLIYKTDTLPKIVNGDKLVLDKPYFIKKIMLPNSEELDVVSHEVIETPVNYAIVKRDGNAFNRATENQDEVLGKQHYTEQFKVYRCLVKTSANIEHYINIIHEDSEAAYEEIRKRSKESALHSGTEFFEKKEMWKQYFDLEKKFAWAKYNYCLTAHKSQGSTYDNCMSMEWDIEQDWDIQERNRIRYVAATRARHKLFIVK